MIGKGLRCYIPSFVEIGTPVQEMILKVFPYMSMAAIYGHGGHLGHVTITMLTNFHFPVPESLHTKLGSKWPSGIRGFDWPSGFGDV